MRKIKWFLKQLLPLTYRTHYKLGGKPTFCVWQMWFGKCFNIDQHQIVQ
jgi:hypothetical protein